MYFIASKRGDATQTVSAIQTLQ